MKMMWTSPEKLPNLSIAGVIIGFILCCASVYFQMCFRHAALALPADTEIRPMHDAVITVGLVTLGFILALPCSVVGIRQARTERNRTGFWLGRLGCVSACCLSHSHHDRHQNCAVRESSIKQGFRTDIVERSSFLDRGILGEGVCAAICRRTSGTYLIIAFLRVAQQWVSSDNPLGFRRR
jgi:hypothetical protein